MTPHETRGNQLVASVLTEVDRLEKSIAVRPRLAFVSENSFEAVLAFAKFLCLRSHAGYATDPPPLVELRVGHPLGRYVHVFDVAVRPSIFVRDDEVWVTHVAKAPY